MGKTFSGSTIVDRVLNAHRPEDLFEDLDGWDPDPMLAIDKAFKRFAWVHPDRCYDPRAEDAFKHLTQLAERAKDRVRRGVYGAAFEVVRVTAKRHVFEIGEQFAEGDSCRVYRADYGPKGAATGTMSDGVVKVAGSPAVSDLMAAEMRGIRAVLADEDTAQYMAPYVPSPVASFSLPGSGGRRRANAFEYVPGLHTLEQVRSVYQRGVHPKDMAWMWRRLTTALGMAHQQGIVHGAVLPEHVLIMPEQHGMLIVDWKYSRPKGERLTAIPSDRRSWYPEVLLEQRVARPELDIAMGARCMEWVCGGREALPRPIRAYLKGCQASRMPDAWELQDEFSDLVERLWGPRTFRPFAMP